MINECYFLIQYVEFNKFFINGSHLQNENQNFPNLTYFQSFLSFCGLASGLANDFALLKLDQIMNYLVNLKYYLVIKTCALYYKNLYFLNTRSKIQVFLNLKGINLFIKKKNTYC